MQHILIIGCIYGHREVNTMKKTKLISVTLVTCIGLSLFAGCNGQGALETVTQQTSASTSAALDTAAGGASDSDETTGGVIPVNADLSCDRNLKDLNSEDEGRYRKGYVDFSFNILKKCIEGKGHDVNIMVSPASIMLALDLTAAGGKGQTLAEMTGLFGGAEDPTAQISYAADLMERLNNSRGVKMHAANSVWVNKTVVPDGLKKDYYDFIHKRFDAEADSLVFDNNAKDKINGWVNDKTDKMIPSIVQQLDPDMAMMLINAICFDGKWAVQYDDSKVFEDNFTFADGSINKVQMMNGTESTYLENDLATGFIKEYEGGQYAFVVMLPKDKKMDAGSLLASFDGKTFDEYMKSASTDYTVYTKMPEFSYDWESSLVPYLKALGMNAPFLPTADFSGLTDLKDGENLYIGDVLHKTHIEVDRAGTKAAAVTAVMLYKNAVFVDPDMKKEVFCDRPFAYAIVDTTDNTPVFVGTVNQVEAN